MPKGWSGENLRDSTHHHPHHPLWSPPVTARVPLGQPLYICIHFRSLSLVWGQIPVSPCHGSVCSPRCKNQDPYISLYAVSLLSLTLVWLGPLVLQEEVDMRGMDILTPRDTAKRWCSSNWNPRLSDDTVCVTNTLGGFRPNVESPPWKVDTGTKVFWVQSGWRFHNRRI